MTYRYDCHLAAGFMQKHHNVRLEPDNLTIADPYVLLPHPGDLCLIAGGNEAHQVNRCTLLPKGQKIIQRNGIVFIWPQEIDDDHAPQQP